ncbi:TonB-dependent siderophore receptor [Xanthomonas hyacinthi]|uniref:TonB-dependent siderophore receptor n=1 Tax=Xanthomonas hyacinthi TaxID=56455 RepID=UPI00130321B6|nr:TonB-dependent siderophore receptor [Xanthomonas hyacinthi]
MPGEGIQDSAFYDRVEIVRGATGLLSGAGNPSASINLIRKRPTQDFSASASVSAGSWDNYRGVFDVSTPLTGDGRIRGRIVAVDQDSRSFLDHYKIKRQSLYGIIDTDLTSSTTLSIGYQYSHADPNGMPWGGQPLFYSNGSPAHWPRSTNLAADWSTWDSTVKTAFVDLEQRFDNGWKLRTELSQKRANADSRFLSGLGYPNQVTGQGLIPVTTRGILDTRQDSADVMASGPFQLFGRQHELVVGAMTSKHTSDDRETGFLFPHTPIGNFYNWSGSYPEPDFDSARYALTQTRVKQSGVYSAARFSLADPIKLIVGGRFSNYEVDQETGAKAFHYKKTAKFIPYVGLVYDINDTYSAYASYTEIFNPQTSRDKNGDVLAPTSGKNTEVGIKGEYLNGKLNASIALFEAKLDNVAQIDAGHLLPDGTQAYYAASGTKSKGVDFDLQGELASGWNLYAGVSHFTASNGDGSRMSSQIPRTTARLYGEPRSVMVAFNYKLQ